MSSKLTRAAYERLIAEDREHVPLSGYPGGCDECQAGDCDCGEFRPEVTT